MDNHHEADHFFHTFSKVIILVPIVIVILSILFKMQNAYDLATKYTLTPTPSKIVTPTIAADLLSQNASPEAKVDYSKPVLCEYATASASARIYIQDYQVKGSLKNVQKQQSFLITKDCAYMYSVQQGKKICGLSQFMPLIFMSYQNNGIEGLLSLLPSQEKSLLPDDAFLQQLEKSCVNEQVKESFSIPTNVVFKEEAVKSPVQNIFPTGSNK